MCRTHSTGDNSSLVATSFIKIYSMQLVYISPITKQWQLILTFEGFESVLKISSKTLHVLSNIWMSLTRLPWKQSRMLLGGSLYFTEYWTTMKFIDKTDNSHLGSLCLYCYFLDNIGYAVLFMEMVSTKYWNLIKTVSCFQVNFVYCGLSEEPLFLELECYYSPVTVKWWTNS
jgi:hypothetical protein